MIIKQLILKEGIECSNDVFSSKHNLIFSKTNTKGKTTYLRLLFYSLGYPIPNMKGINFERIETRIIFSEKNREYTVERNGNLLKLTIESEKLLFTLPSEHDAFLSYVFQYNNLKVIRNLLGFLYIDQDKGWSLLNRGTVIGRIKFSIEELLAGLNNTDITPLLENKKRLEYDRDKYSALLNIQELSEQVYEHHGELFISDVEKELTEKISYINLKISNLNASLKEINALVQKEKQFFDYIDSMRLYVKGPDGDIGVTRETLVNAPESTEFLKARQSVLVTDIEKLKRQRTNIENQLSNYKLKNSQISLFPQESKDDIIDKKLASFASIDQEMVSDLLTNVSEELRQTRSKIKSAVKLNNNYITRIYNYVLDYANRLDIEEIIVHKEDYIFTSDLKSVSGAVLQKLVFAFKVAFLKVIEEELGTKLFMVIDSPKSKELDDPNTELIMKLIKEELDDNQVFIASIYEFECDHKVLIHSRAIEAR